jgi:hypothetical protein
MSELDVDTVRRVLAEEYADWRTSRIKCDLLHGAELLETYGEHPFNLGLYLDDDVEEENDDEEDDDLNTNREQLIRRFVAGLRDHDQIRRIEFNRGLFASADRELPVVPGADGPGARDLDDLFGYVLPNHPSLTEIGFYECSVESALLERLFRSLPTGPIALSSLDLETVPLTVETCTALGNMLKENVQLESLSVRNGLFDSEGCKLICDGAAANEHLEGMFLSDPGTLSIQLDTFARLFASPRCGVRYLGVIAHSWTPVGYAAFVRGLSTHRKLERVLLGHDYGREQLGHPELLENMLRWHNYTLTDLCICPDPRRDVRMRIDALLARNASIKAAASSLAERNYRVLPLALWPQVMDKIGTLPSLLYVLLRRGSVDEFARCVLLLRSRRRPRPRDLRTAASDAELLP